MSIINKSLQHLEPTIESWDFTKIPLIVGVSGPQGSGKSYLSEKLTQELSIKYPKLQVATVSIDDFYLTYEQQNSLVNKNKDCELITNGRGLPGTHDLELIFDFLQNCQDKKSNYKVPKYDKSCFNGKGDRSKDWNIVDKPIDILIFEGWFLGFKAINEGLSNDWGLAIETSENSTIKKWLSSIDYSQIATINNLLKDYEKIYKFFNKFIFIFTNDLLNIYNWRLEQEHELIKVKGKGMTDDQVVKFVDRYYPLYKLYYKEFELGIAKGDNFEIVIDFQRDILDTKVY